MENNFSELRYSVLKERNTAIMRGILWLILALLLCYLAWDVDFLSVDLSVSTLTAGQVWLLVSLIPWSGVAIFCHRIIVRQKLLSEARYAHEKLREAAESLSIDVIESVITNCQAKGKRNPLVYSLLESWLPGLKSRLSKLKKEEACAALYDDAQKTIHDIDIFLKDTKNDLPVIKAQVEIQTSLEFLERRREELQAQWDAAYEQFSWWNKLKYGGGPDFSKIDRMLKDLRFMDRQIKRIHGEDFAAIEKHFETIRAQAVSRVWEAKESAEQFVREIGDEASVGSDILGKAMWLGMLSIPVSAWFDIDRAGNIFDALRGVNGDFAGMSDAEIWWQTLFLPTESLSGLAALTKGAYFEQLVAADTGGQLFDHFNHPNTDIVVDGTAFQIKATDSESYVNSVADGIPVIATSEVAMATGSIDSGYSNEELSNAVDLALGSTVVDIGDTAVDAILAGVGGLGFFATLEGLNHAVKKHENGGDGVEAIFEGAGVAIEGTARALVGAAEMSYKVLSSKPSRFVGRMLLKGLVKLDEKMAGNMDRD